MVKKSDILKALKPSNPPSKVSSHVQGGMGYDNIRENIDPHVKTKALSAKEVYSASGVYTDITVTNANISAAEIDNISGTIIMASEKFDLDGGSTKNTGIRLKYKATTPVIRQYVKTLGTENSGIKFATNTLTLEGSNNNTGSIIARDKIVADRDLYVHGAFDGRDTRLFIGNQGSIDASAIYNDSNYLILDPRYNSTDILMISGAVVVNEWGGDFDTRIEGDTIPNLFFVDASADRVGIGIALPTATLTVSGSAIFNEIGADHDFRVESDGDDHMLFVDAGNNRVGIGTNAPATTLGVDGVISITGSEGVRSEWLNDNTLIHMPFQTGSSYDVGLKGLAGTREARIYAKSPDGDSRVTIATGATPTTRVTIEDDGDILFTEDIGINATPTYQLHINGKDTANDGIFLTTPTFNNIPNPGTIANSVILNPRGFGFSTDSAVLSPNFDTTFGIGLAISRATVPVLAIKNAAGPAMLVEQGNVGIGIFAPSVALHVSGAALINQSSTTGAVPVLRVEQADVSEEFIRFIGTSADTILTQSIVQAADVATATIQGYLKIFVQDDGNQLTDQAYFVPFYTLA